MNAPLARFLVEFTTEKTPEPVEIAEPEPVETVPLVSITVEDFVQKLRESRELATATERARVETELAARFAAEKAAMVAAFAMERELWANNQGRQLSASLVAAFAQLESQLLTSLANALRPLLSEVCRSRILAELGSALETILGDPSHPSIRIEGPADLLTAFGDANPTEVAIDYVVSDRAELTIITDSTRVETRLSACLAAFQPIEG